MIGPATPHGSTRGLDRAFHQHAENATLSEELERLRAENRRLAVSLGGFSAFMASRGLLEDAWHYVHTLHKLDES